MSRRRCLSSSRWVAGSSCHWGLCMHHSGSPFSKRSHRARRGCARPSPCASCPLPDPRIERRQYRDFGSQRGGCHELQNHSCPERAALLLARKFDSYIEGFALRVAIPAAHEMVDVGTIAIPPLERDIAENAKQTRSLFETFMQQHGVPRGGSATSLSFEWLEDAPEGDHFVGSHGRLFDVIVLGRPARDLKGSRMTTLEAALFESGRPVLIAPPSPRAQIGTYPLIAWNCSTEHARTIALAMPILKQASRV